MMTKKIEVSLDSINQIMSLLIEGMSGQPDEIFGLNMVNENSIRILVDSYLLSEYKDEPYIIQKNFKNSLKYAINFIPEEKLRKNLSDEIYIVYFPENMSLIEFYKNLWKYMFPDEEYFINNEEKENYILQKKIVY